MFSLAAPTPLDFFAALVGDDDQLPLLEAAASIAQDEYPDLDVQQVLGGAVTLYFVVLLLGGVKLREFVRK